MTPLATALLVCAFGSVGAVARFVVDGMVRARLGTRLPWATFAINVTGSALLGLLGGLVVSGRLPAPAGVILGTGFCGGYTTFSTATVETLTLLREHRPAAAAGYAAGTLAACVAAATAALGLGAAR